MWHRSLPRIFASLYAAACFLPLPIWSGAGSDWREPAFWIHPMQDDTAQAARDIAFLRGHPGPAMCESLAWCYWAGKPASVDVYNLDQQLRSGARPLASFLPLIRAHRFAAIELDETIPFPLPKPVEAAILRNYRIDHADDEGTFFLRR